MRKILTALAAVLCVGVALSVQPAAEPADVAAAGLPYPRLAVVYYDRPDSRLAALARWDLWVGASEPADRAAVRRINPNATVLAYQITTEDCAQPRSFTNRSQGFQDEWWLRSSKGQQYTFWRDCPMVNQSAASPVVNGQRFNQFFAQYARDRLTREGGFDGVFFDNAWDRIDWKAADYGGDIDLNRDGINDFIQFGTAWVNAQWSEGYRQLMSAMRGALGPNAIILGGDARTNDWTNGRLWEGWPEGDDTLYGSGWFAAMQNYQEWQNRHYGDFVYVVLSYPSAQQDYRTMRFGLTSALLGDGYFAAAAGVNDHTALWWYDEYSVDFESGWATADASRKGYLGFPADVPATYPNGVWRRDFDNGIVLVNPTSSPKTVDLGNVFRKIRGTQDPSINNGEAVSVVTIGDHDGLILLRRPNSARVQNTPDNLIANARFDDGAVGWAAWHGQVSVVPDGRFGEAARVVFAAPEAADPQATVMTVGSWPGVDLSPKPNADFEATAWIRGEGDTIGKQIFLVIRNRSPDGEDVAYSQPYTVQAGWQQVAVRHRIERAGAASLDVYVQLNNAAPGDVLFVDDATLVDRTGLQSKSVLPFVLG